MPDEPKPPEKPKGDKFVDTDWSHWKFEPPAKDDEPAPPDARALAPPA